MLKNPVQLLIERWGLLSQKKWANNVGGRNQNNMAKGNDPMAGDEDPVLDELDENVKYFQHFVTRSQMASCLVQNNADGLLKAIMIVDHELAKEIFAEMTRGGDGQSLRGFPTHLTPLMVACLQNDYEMVSFFLAKGHKIQLPHRSSCKNPLRWEYSMVALLGISNYRSMLGVWRGEGVW